MPRRAARAAALLSSLTLAATGAELVARYVDGYQLTAFRLSAAHRSNVSELTRTALENRLVQRIPLASGVDRRWYATDPTPLPEHPLSADRQARVDRNPDDPYGTLFEWNLHYLRESLCAGLTVGSLGILPDFHVFTPPAMTPYPTYRHLRGIWRPGWLVANRFGWRGPDIDLNKPPGTIRLAFVGASTTVSRYALPFSHPEYIVHWLNLWAQSQGRSYRFESINAGRTGINSHSIAAIVDQEVAPAEPDLTIYYEGANQFWPGTVLELPPGTATAPVQTFAPPTWVEQRSALARRAVFSWRLVNGRSGDEPSKPTLAEKWPAGLDLKSPDLSRADLPSNLSDIVADLDAIAASLKAFDGELAVSSFIWLVHPGLRLDPDRHQVIDRYLNATYWPASYALMRKLADFQNEVFRTYAAQRHVTFLDVANGFPAEPDLFGDSIHMHSPGLRLQAWTYLQMLVPIIEARVASGRWPRPMTHRREAHPAFDNATEALATRASILAECGH
jgi:hypothetical protein